MSKCLGHLGRSRVLGTKGHVPAEGDVNGLLDTLQQPDWLCRMLVVTCSSNKDPLVL